MHKMFSSGCLQIRLYMVWVMFGFPDDCWRNPGNMPHYGGGFCLLVEGEKSIKDRNTDARALLFYPNNATIKSAFEMALYDLATKCLEEPLYKLLAEKNGILKPILPLELGNPAKWLIWHCNLKVAEHLF